MIVPNNKLEMITQWCVANVGPRQYWIQHKIGGKGWRLDKAQNGWLLTVDDEVSLTMLLLKVAI